VGRETCAPEIHKVIQHSKQPAMVVNIHIYSAATFFCLPQLFSRFLSLCRNFLGFLGDPKIVAAQVDLPHFFS
jgi:hypothetical protein